METQWWFLVALLVIVAAIAAYHRVKQRQADRAHVLGKSAQGSGLARSLGDETS